MMRSAHQRSLDYVFEPISTYHILSIIIDYSLKGAGPAFCPCVVCLRLRLEQGKHSAVGVKAPVDLSHDGGAWSCNKLMIPS